MKVKYENSVGTVLDLNDGNYFVNANDLRNFAWEYSTLARSSGLGGRVRRFSRPPSEKVMRVAIRGADFKAKINALHALTEVDILSRTPGKLWLDGQYLICYLGTASEITVDGRGRYAEKELTILAVSPFWHTETEIRRFSPSSGGIAGGKKYNLRYPYRFGTGYSNQTLYNAHYAPAPMRITLFGPVTDPSIMIGGNTYAIEGELLDGERIEIDQMDRKLTKIDASGSRYDMFNKRDKEHDIFAPCPSGAVAVQFSAIVFEIVLIQQRSEPLWI